MKAELVVLLDNLQAERAALLRTKEELTSQLRQIQASRQQAARLVVWGLLPDLSKATISALQSAVPWFTIPMVSAYWGLGRKLDPSITLDTLRVQLGIHLDNVRSSAPAVWLEKVEPHEREIQTLYAVSILPNEESIADVNKRIAAIEKLMGLDLDKMDRGMRERIGQAVTAQAKRSNVQSRASRPIPRGPVIYPGDGDSLLETALEMWFWYELLTDGSDLSSAVEAIEYEDRDLEADGPEDGQHDEFDGADSEDGADSSVSDEGELRVHEDLGSQSFS